MTSSGVPSKRFAYKLALAIDAGCLASRHYVPWADGVISRLDRPPAWICELSISKHQPDALRVIHEFVYSEPFEQLDGLADTHLGYLWIRFERDELSWATLLEKAGNYADGGTTDIECEYFYSMLNELEAAEFSADVEDNQCKAVRLRLAKAIQSANEFYAQFKANN